jgi:hypothetical protein
MNKRVWGALPYCNMVKSSKPYGRHFFRPASKATPLCRPLWGDGRGEDQFDARWHGWLDQAEAWKDFFTGIQAIAATDLLHNMRQLELITDNDVTNISHLRRSTEGKAVPISETGGVDDPLLTLV